MNKTVLLLLSIGLTIGSTQAHSAGWCGAGKITHIKEGGWGYDHFMIKIDYTEQNSVVGGEYGSGWIRFLGEGTGSLTDRRLNGIKALAYMAFSGNKTVQIYTSGTQCRSADDITIFKPGQQVE